VLERLGHARAIPRRGPRIDADDPPAPHVDLTEPIERPLAGRDVRGLWRVGERGALVRAATDPSASCEPAPGR
jgi:hypothetical protein